MNARNPMIHGARNSATTPYRRRARRRAGRRGTITRPAAPAVTEATGTRAGAAGRELVVDLFRGRLQPRLQVGDVPRLPVLAEVRHEILVRGPDLARLLVVRALIGEHVEERLELRRDVERG